MATLVDYMGLCEVATPEPEYRPSRDSRRLGEDILSYQPVSFACVADGVRDSFSEALDLEPTSESYALARGGTQVFGIMAWRDPALEQGIAVALRASHDKSFSVAIAAGSHTFVCANGCFPRGSQVSHKHTSGILNTLPGMIAAEAAGARVATIGLIEAMASLRGIACSDYRFAAYLGILQWEGFINDTLANRARRYWRACRTGELHAEHGDADMYGALQSVTGGLGGRVSPSGSFGAYGGALHVAQQIVDHGGDTDVVMPPLPAMREYA
tara:strand:- start:29 stop:838 length:810 start_codon:yes stop_codon:yes gene_type:complete